MTQRVFVYEGGVHNPFDPPPEDPDVSRMVGEDGRDIPMTPTNLIGPSESHQPSPTSTSDGTGRFTTAIKQGSGRSDGANRTEPHSFYPAYDD